MTWNPWRALRSRPHIVFRLASLPAETGGAVYWPRGSRAAIIIDPTLRRTERNAALAELVHDERGGGAGREGMPASWAPVVAREEASVDREVARRLVPADELEKFLEVMGLLDLGVTARDVAEHFEVPEAVAAEALRSSM